MNVLIVAPWDQDRGGVATVANKLARHLSENGHPVSFFHPGMSESPVRKTTRAGYPGFEQNLRSPFIPGRPLRSTIAFWLTLPRTLYRLVQLLREEQVDIVSIHYPIQSFVYFALCRLLLGVRVVVSVHGADLMPNGERPAYRPRALRWLLHNSDYLTAPSVDYLESILVEFPYLRERSIVIHNGIDITEFEDGAAESSSTGNNILCIAAHNPKKGLDILIRAMAQVRPRGLDLQLVLVGDGPLRPELEGLAQKLGVADLVHFAGFQELPAVRCHLSKCKLFVLPSRAEPFGIVILEAMIHGKPVIATHVGGIPEIVTHLENGYLVPPDDPEALANALCTLCSDPALRQRLGGAGLATVQERFTHRHTGSKFESLFAGLIT